MPGQYDYTVNIPQPPAQNFLQSLLGIQQLKGLQQQQDIQGQQAQQQAVTFDQSQQDRTRILQEQAAAKEQTKQLFGELQGMSANAPIEDVVKITNKLALINPPAAKQVNDNFNKLSEQYQNNAKIISTQAGSLLEAEKYQDAAYLYNEAAKAVRDKAGDNQNLLNLAKGYEIQAKLSVSSPVSAKTGIATLLGVIDPAALNAITAARKQEAETPMKAAELEGKLLENRLAQQKLTGGLDQQERFKAEATERAHIESQQFVRKYVDSRTAFEIMKTADPTASGDEALLTQFVKMGDPGSVVSVTEKSGVRNVTLTNYISSLQAKLTNDGSLGEAKRKELKNQAYKMLKASEQGYNEYTGKLEPVYKERGLNPKNIFVLPSSEQLREDAKKQTAGPAGAPGVSINVGTSPVAPSYTPPTGVTIKSVR